MQATKTTTRPLAKKQVLARYPAKKYKVAICTIHKDIYFFDRPAGSISFTQPITQNESVDIGTTGLLAVTMVKFCGATHPTASPYSHLYEIVL